MNNKSIDQVSESGVEIDNRACQSTTLFSTVLEKIVELTTLATNNQNQPILLGNTQRSAPGSLSNLSIAEKQKLGLHHYMD